MSDDHYSTRGNNPNPEPLLPFVKSFFCHSQAYCSPNTLKINVKLLSRSNLAFPGKRGSVTLAEIPPSLEFAEIEGEDGVSLDHTTAGEKEKKAQFSQVNITKS